MASKKKFKLMSAILTVICVVFVAEAAAPAIPGLRLRRIPGHEVAISSSELRGRANRGLPLWPFVPLKVADFIESQSLYRTNP